MHGADLEGSKFSTTQRNIFFLTVSNQASVAVRLRHS